MNVDVIFSAEEVNSWEFIRVEDTFKCENYKDAVNKANEARKALKTIFPNNLLIEWNIEPITDNNIRLIFKLEGTPI